MQKTSLFDQNRFRKIHFTLSLVYKAVEGFGLIQKYVILEWVVFVRCFLVSVPVAIVSYCVGDALSLISDQTGCFEVLLIALLELVLYERIGRHIRDTRTGDSFVHEDSLQG